MPSNKHTENFSETEAWMRQFTEVRQALHDEHGYNLSFDVFHKFSKTLVSERAAKMLPRVPCKRKLKYIGYDRWDEPDRSELNSSEDDFFEYGKIYYSIDFNGATYSIEGYSANNDGKVIGCAFFEWIRDDVDGKDSVAQN